MNNIMVENCGSPSFAPPFTRHRSSSRDKDDRKRKRETALVSFERSGSLEGLSSLSIQDPSPCEGCAIVKASYNPNNKGILKTRPILKGALQERYKSKSHKKRKVLFDEETLKELEKEKEHEPPKRKVDEHNTPYHDTYHHLSCDDVDFLVPECKHAPPPSPKEGSHLHFQFNVQFNFTKPKVKSKIFMERTKELIQEEGAMFKLMVNARLPQSDDMEDDMDNGSIEQIMREANIPAPSFWAQTPHSPNYEDGLPPLSPSSPVFPLPDLLPISPQLLLPKMSSRFLFQDEVVRGSPDTEEGSPMSDAFVFSAPPSSVSRSGGFTYRSGGLGAG